MPARPPAPWRPEAPPAGRCAGAPGGGGPSGFPAPGPAILPEPSPGWPCRVVPSLGGAGRAPACLVAAAGTVTNVPAFRLTQDCCEFSPPLGLLGARRKWGRAGGARDPWAAHAAGVQAPSPHVARADGLTSASSPVRNDPAGLESIPGAPRQLLFLSEPFSGADLALLGCVRSTVDFKPQSTLVVRVLVAASGGCHLFCELFPPAPAPGTPLSTPPPTPPSPARSGASYQPPPASARMHPLRPALLPGVLTSKQPAAAVFTVRPPRGPHSCRCGGLCCRVSPWTLPHTRCPGVHPFPDSEKFPTGRCPQEAYTLIRGPGQTAATETTDQMRVKESAQQPSLRLLPLRKWREGLIGLDKSGVGVGMGKWGGGGEVQGLRT